MRSRPVLGEEDGQLGSEHVRLEPMNHVSDIGNFDETMIFDLADSILLVFQTETPRPRDDQGGRGDRFE